MKILVIYYSSEPIGRSSFREHLYSFRKYSAQSCYYLNVAYGTPRFITSVPFDLVIYHYAFFGLKWNVREFKSVAAQNSILKNLKGYKIAIPQDEYIYSDAVCAFFREFGIKAVYTCLPESEWQKVYPKEKTGLEHYRQVLAGYIDETAIEKVAAVRKPHAERTVDLGYRARKTPFWLGKASVYKWRITEVFSTVADKRNMRFDLSNDEQKVFTGFDWYLFLCNCRVVLGCESGASLHDPDGTLREKVERYLADNPAATFEETEQSCFPGLDGNLNLSVISSRIFEACITKTCQVLIEGTYNNILKDNLHFIPLKKDFSNLNEVLGKMKDVAFCEQMAEQAFADIIQSRQYTYRAFVAGILADTSRIKPSDESITDPHPVYLKLLEWRARAPAFFAFSKFIKIRVANFLIILAHTTKMSNSRAYKKIASVFKH